MQLRFFIFALLIFGQRLYPTNVDRMIEAIDSQSSSQIIAVFDSMESMTFKEARHFINELYDHYHQARGCDLQKPRKKSFFSSLSFVTCDCNWGKNLGSLIQHHPFFPSAFMSHLTPPLVNMGMYTKIHQIKSLLLTCSDFDDDVLPADLVLEGVEMLVGALICILPFPPAKWLGGVIVADGINRTFNGVREVDEQNRAYMFAAED